MDPEDLYATIRATGIDHGPIFQNIQTVNQRENQSVASVKVADTAATMPCGHEDPHVIHPTTIDSIFQASYSAYLATPESGSKLTLLPGWWLSEEKERQWSPSLSVGIDSDG